MKFWLPYLEIIVSAIVGVAIGYLLFMPFLDPKRIIEDLPMIIIATLAGAGSAMFGSEKVIREWSHQERIMRSTLIGFAGFAFGSIATMLIHS